MNDYYAQHVKEQNEDLKTMALREDFKINLTDKEDANLKLMAYKAGFDTPGEFLASFVGDLTGWHSNGSDERDLAGQWYERAFGMSNEYSNFRYFLYNFDYDLEAMAEMIEDDDYFDEVYQEYLEENSHMTNQKKEECLETLKEILEGGKEL